MAEGAGAGCRSGCSRAPQAGRTACVWARRIGDVTHPPRVPVCCLCLAPLVHKMLELMELLVGVAGPQ